MNIFKSLASYKIHIYNRVYRAANALVSAGTILALAWNLFLFFMPSFNKGTKMLEIRSRVLEILGID